MAMHQDQTDVAGPMPTAQGDKAMEGLYYNKPKEQAEARSDFASASPSIPISTTPMSTAPAIAIDYTLYEHYLENSDLTETQRKEFLDALWNIIVNFVDLAFGVHPLQQVSTIAQNDSYSDADNDPDNQSDCEQVLIAPQYLLEDASGVLRSTDTHNPTHQQENDQNTIIRSSGGKAERRKP